MVARRQYEASRCRDCQMKYLRAGKFLNAKDYDQKEVRGVINKPIILVITLGETQELTVNLDELVDWRDRWSEADDEAFSAIDRVSEMKERGAEFLDDQGSGLKNLMECWKITSEENKTKLGGGLREQEDGRPIQCDGAAWRGRSPGDSCSYAGEREGAGRAHHPGGQHV